MSSASTSRIPSTIRSEQTARRSTINSPRPAGRCSSGGQGGRNGSRSCRVANADPEPPGIEFEFDVDLIARPAAMNDGVCEELAEY